MVQLSPHPEMCERCRTLHARVRHRKQVDGAIMERWLCYDCAAAVLDGAEDIDPRTPN